MTLAVVRARALRGVQAPPVEVEVHISNGLPGLSIVGLPDTEVREARDRVRSALLNAQFEFPARRITVNLAPADLPKAGGRFDLPIAVGILAASGQVPMDRLPEYEFAGELALSGELRPVQGVLSSALAAREAGRALILPRANAVEAALASGLPVLPADHLRQVVDHLRGDAQLDRLAPLPRTHGDDNDAGDSHHPAAPDLADVRGQQEAKRVLEIAAAGAHSLLLTGPPGSGKSMLAARLPGLLPEMSEAEATESAALHSLTAQGVRPAHWRRRPYRAPHHTASGIALVGGGGHPRPGEISLAHHGVLFLDELPEFNRRVLEVLREPLENGEITIARAGTSTTYPARFQLIAAMNPCPCGYLGDPHHACRCTPDSVQNYRARISGPLLDRIDLHIEVPAVPYAALFPERATGQVLGATSMSAPVASTTREVRRRVCAARQCAWQRQQTTNASLGSDGLSRHCPLDDRSRALLARADARWRLSARGHHRILRVARTIADLAGETHIGEAHLAEAIRYRGLGEVLP